jgi:hypothetical protein
MKISIVRIIAKNIIINFNSENLLLVDWMSQNIDLILEVTIGNCDYEQIYESFCDGSTRDFYLLSKELRKQIISQSPINRIELIEDYDGVRIELSDIGNKSKSHIANRMMRSFTEIEKLSKMDKGLFYEEFCCRFLNDLGIEAEKTPASNDKGIDIKARYKVQLDEKLSQLFFNDYVYLLGQAKFFSKKVDTPVLRKLVGDSIFLRFDQLDYIDIAHNAIHLVVFSHNGFTESAHHFSKKNKIMVMDTIQIISLVAASETAMMWTCYQYLEITSAAEALPTVQP